MNLALIKEFPGITLFSQFGFKPEGKGSGSNVYGTCPLCLKEKHFYINTEKKLWDCKRCNKSGNIQSFLDLIFDKSREDPNLDELAKNRGLNVGTLDHFYIGYMAPINSFLIPIWDMQQDKLLSLKIYSNKKLIISSGSKTCLFNWWDLLGDQETIYICEGEWDGMAMYEILDKLNLHESSIMVAIPGANSFKSEWGSYFKHKKVVSLLDNDEAGRLGSAKIYGILKPIVKELKFLQWGKEFPDKFDLRDLYVKQEKGNASRTLKFINTRLADYPVAPTTKNGVLKKVVPLEAKETSRLTEEFTKAEEVYNGYRKWLHLPDVLIIDFLFGATIANRLGGDPIWGQIVGPSGATKTELIQSLNEAPFAITASSLTPHSLISGANFGGGGDPSLLPKWNGKVVLIKDLTVLMNLNPLAREEIFGILRDAYDGFSEKTFGNGVHRAYHTKFGIIAGVTPIIEIYAEEHTALGERFLRFPVTVPTNLKGKMELTRRALKNTMNEDVMRKDLRDFATKILSFDFKKIPEISEEMTEKLMYSAQLVAMLRGTIKRDNYTKDITHAPFSEMATRLSKQFKKLILGVGMFRGLDLIDNQAYEVIKRIVLGTIPSRMKDLIAKIYLTDKKRQYTLVETGEILRLPSATTIRILDSMVALNSLDKIVPRPPMQPTWKLSKEFLQVLESSEVFKKGKPCIYT